MPPEALRTPRSRDISDGTAHRNCNTNGELGQRSARDPGRCSAGRRTGAARCTHVTRHREPGAVAVRRPRPVSQATSRKRRSASRITSLVEDRSAAARASSAAFNSGSIRTGTTSAGADPIAGRPRRRCVSIWTWILRARPHRRPHRDRPRSTPFPRPSCMSCHPSPISSLQELVEHLSQFIA